ncbi:biotin--[acetyl-CoA-carboxylase] ligase [Fulvivirgaceae bacterium BMA12]|uniref:Biotin--[acetyl-CoA-carboxylase] ligase n=1 Tax=Agaribacillus aureus TaxID=3051825 RepID=A0ABT8L3P7_9BACT|nr:biotin--[acetyl-CoA-carboxylase] ligase [Fulvivirgaceae bacterium BMA12]
MPICHSTNDVAIEIVENGDYLDGTLVIADTQLKGRGQRGNNWESEKKKNLTFSVIIKPGFLPLSHQFLLNIFTSLAVVDTLTPYVTSGLKIKWPNDIYHENQKMGGILIENTVKGTQLYATVIGIGLNINQLDFKVDNATSLSSICERFFDLQQLLKALVLNMEKRYFQLKNEKYDMLRHDYMKSLFWYNQLRWFKADRVFQGKIIGVDESGKLQLMENLQTRSYDLKEITYLIEEDVV